MIAGYLPILSGMGRETSPRPVQGPVPLRHRFGAIPFALWGGIVLPALLVAGCAQPPAPTAARHPTVVSLNPCSDAILSEIAAPGQLLAISHYSHDPASSSMDVARARQFRATSGAVEEVARLAPDVVVAGTFLAPATRRALEDLGIRVVTLAMPADIADSRAQVRQLGALVGNPRGGAAMVARIDAAIVRARPQIGDTVGHRPLSALVWESGGIVAGEGTLIADLLRHAGFANGTAARGLSQADFLPLERVLADPPQVIFAVGDGRSDADRMLRHPALRHLRATTRAPLDGALLWCGGPTIPRALDRLARVYRAQLHRKAGET